MRINDFLDVLQSFGIEYFTGVPDSQLKALCDALIEQKEDRKHLIAANEGNAVGLAAGYYMATGKIPCVYMQNSGLGNVINPCASLIHPRVYGIPMVFVIGFRGEPGVKDEPQHIFQGEITLQLLEDLGIRYCLLEEATTPDECKEFIKEHADFVRSGESIAFVVRKNGLTKETYLQYKNPYLFSREAAIEAILTTEGFADVVVSTTGKISREVFEVRSDAAVARIRLPDSWLHGPLFYDRVGNRFGKTGEADLYFRWGWGIFDAYGSRCHYRTETSNKFDSCCIE